MPCEIIQTMTRQHREEMGVTVNDCYAERAKQQLLDELYRQVFEEGVTPRPAGEGGFAIPKCRNCGIIYRGSD